MNTGERGEHANLWGLFRVVYGLCPRGEGEPVPKMVWRVKLVAELERGWSTEVEVARLERDEQAGLADLGLRLAEVKQISAAIQAEIVPVQVTAAGEHRRTCVACEGVLASKGYYTATFRSLFGDVPIRIRRLLTCPCQSGGAARSFAAFSLEAATVAPELAYVSARYAALAPFGKVADLLSELLPISGAQNAGTVRNRTMRVGEAVAQRHVTTTTGSATAQPAEPVVIGLDGGYVRSRHRQDERHFEVIAGKVIDAQGGQSRFAFARNSPTIASDAFKQVLATAGVTADTPATVLSDGDAGLWRLQRDSLPNATIVLDWWHAAVLEHALQAARGLGAADTHLSGEAVRGLERTKWRLWHGRWPGCRNKLAALCRWMQRTYTCGVAGIGRLEHHVTELLGYLERNQGALVHDAGRRRSGEPISTAFVESSVNEIIAKRMNKKQQMRWRRASVQPFLDVRAAVLNDTLEDCFRHRYCGFRPANVNEPIPSAA
jgi:hypothetical protein